MGWWGYLFFLLGILIFFFATGLPVAFSFLLMNIIGIVLFMGGPGSLFQLILSIYDSITVFVFAPVPLFILMGEIMFYSRMAKRAMDTFEMWLGKVPGRLSLLAILGGTVFASLTGSQMANTAMLGSTLAPEMRRRGYSKSMSLGPILGAGGIAIMIPPSSLGVILGSLAYIPIAKILIAGIFPGILMATLYACYVVIRCRLNPSLAPTYLVPSMPISRKIIAFLKNVLPLGSIVFLVIGLIILGIATPAESAALGVLGTLLLAWIYGDMSLEVVKKALLGTFRVTVMVFIIIAGATGFSQLLSFTGASRGLVGFIVSLEVNRIFVLSGMIIVLLILGCFMEQVCMMMITIPIFMPLVHALKFDPLWFGLLVLINLEIAATSPPFGLNLFVMKGVSPPDITMGDIYKAAFPYIFCDIIALSLIIVFPSIGLWLPNLIR